MRTIPLLRFNALAGYARQPQAVVYAEELRWFEHADERVLGVLIRDRTDNDFGGLIFAPDRRHRFRWVSDCGFHRSQRRAEVALRVTMEKLAAAPDDEFYQDDEKGAPVDFFAAKAQREKQSKGFLALAELEGYSPARGIITPMMRWYEDADGNFVEQFQTTGFDARIWELYLFAAFIEMGYVLDRSHATPDFVCAGLRGAFSVEAVTVNPSRDKFGNIVPSPKFETDEEKKIFLREYMPIKYASSLVSKLRKRYWEQPHVSGKPFIFAVQDFHAPMSLLHSRSALPIYLYGYDIDWHHDADGRLQVEPRKVECHQWNGKRVESGFFNLPGAENISAVLFSNSGTIAKFNRMGALAKFGSPRVKLFRSGVAVNHDPDAAEPITFRHAVNSPEYSETWCEGLDVYHNPRALVRLQPWMLPGAAHHRLLSDGQTEDLTPDWHPLASVTSILVEDAS